MAYGIKRGIKAPGDFGVSDMLGLALAGSAGIIAALVTDYQQKGEASALFTINQWVVALSSLLGFAEVPLWMVALGLVILGAGSIYYFQPITRQGAFAQGFGLLAVLMTTVPADLVGGLESFNDDLSGLETVSLSREASLNGARVFSASFPQTQQGVGESARVIPVQNREASKYEVAITINFPNGLPDNIDTLVRRQQLRGRLHNEETNQTYNLFSTSGGSLRRDGNNLVVTAGVPAQSNSARLWVRVEAAGYAIEVQSAVAKRGERLNWNVNMTPSDTPLFIQRLGKSYWF